MASSRGRRAFLRAAVGAALVAAWPRSGRPQTSGAPPFDGRPAPAPKPSVPAPVRAADLAVDRLGPDIVALRGAGGNVVAAKTREGLLMVDGGLAAHAEALWQRVTAELGTTQAFTLFNTHWHPEQTGQNARFGKAQATIVAQENTKQWLGIDVQSRSLHETFRALPKDALPNRTFYYGLQHLAVDGRELEYGYMPQAHTDGDIYVYFPDANVLATGGVVSSDGWPVVDWWTGGWIGGMLDGYETLLKRADAKTRIVPAAGPVMSRAELESQYEMFGKIFDRLKGCLEKSLDIPATIAAAPTSGFKAEWGDSSVFVDQAFRSLWGHLRGSPRMRRMP